MVKVCKVLLRVTFSLHNPSRVLYLSGRTKNGGLTKLIYEFISPDEGWIQWGENLLPVPFDNSSFIQLDKDFCAKGDKQFIMNIQEPEKYEDLIYPKLT